MSETDATVQEIRRLTEVVLKAVGTALLLAGVLTFVGTLIVASPDGGRPWSDIAKLGVLAGIVTAVAGATLWLTAVTSIVPNTISTDSDNRTTSR
jgi:hypothetical protein